MVTMTTELPRPMGVRDVTDAGLMERLSHRDSAALEALYDRYGNLVYSTALGILKDTQLAEDVSQEIFLRLWRRPEKYSAERGRFVTWLISITRNQAVDELRRRRRQFRHESASPEQQELELPAGDTTNPAVSVELAEQWDSAREAVARLSPRQRQVIELAYFEGHTQREMADRLGQPLGTVKTRVRQGMLTLRGMFEVAGGGEGAILRCS